MHKAHALRGTLAIAAQAVGALLLVLAMGTGAGAVSFTLGGPGMSASADAAQALYASNSGGQSVLITEVGRDAPDGAAFTEIGIPDMTPNGRVVFGAEETAIDGSHRWDIFVGDPDAPPARRVKPALSVKSTVGACAPRFVTDPYPVADADGDIAFIGGDLAGRQTLFLYSNHKVFCLAQVGSQTTRGRTISVLSYGTLQMGEPGTVVFDGWLKSDKDSAPAGDRQALFMASRQNGVSELAVEGELGPNRTRYLRPFGLPAALPSPEGTLVAFTAKTESGSALFLYHGGVMARILPTGTLTAMGPVTYLSPGRPGLIADGTTAVLAGCAKVPAIFRLERGRLDLRLSRGQLTPYGTELEALGDPALTQSGAMFVGATDSEGREKLYVLDDNNAFFEVGGSDLLYKIALGAAAHSGHSIFTGTLTANQHGDFAYLGGE